MYSSKVNILPFTSGSQKLILSFVQDIREIYLLLRPKTSAIIPFPLPLSQPDD